MMVVPRAYNNALSHRKSLEFNEKNGKTRSHSNSRSSSPRRPSASSKYLEQPSTHKDGQRTDPVRIPLRTTKIQPSERRSLGPTSVPNEYAKPDIPSMRRGSAKELLSATAIPVRKRPKGRPSQRLPRGDHVNEFSKLLWDDIRPGQNGGLSRSASNPYSDGLFGNMDEVLEDGQMFVGSEGVDAGILSTRSMSHESLHSLGFPDEFVPSETASQNSSTSLSIPERKTRQFASSEDCSTDHPLSYTDDGDSFGSLPELEVSPPVSKKPSLATGGSLKATFKSSLTASLKAIKSAAQSISSNTANTNSVTPESEHVLAQSFFDIQPSLTDDRRPPPSVEPPSAEMRRYLNPPPLEAAAQLHFWQDHRHSNFSPPADSKARKSRGLKKKKGKQGPSLKNSSAIVPLATCLPPNIRTAHASSPPIWLNPDGTPTNRNTATSLLYDPDAALVDSKGNSELKMGRHNWRNREPRENRDFLRVFVCEMQMRKHGKLSADLGAGRARLWLPPVDESCGRDNRNPSDSSNISFEGGRKWRRNASDRLSSMSADELM